MKKIIILISIICLVVMLPMSADETGKEKENQLDAKIKFGLGYIGQEDATVKVKEYSPLDDGIKPFIKALFSGNMGKTYFNIVSKFYGDSKDMSHNLKFDFNRVLKQEFSFDSLYHRLDHDPLTNIDVVSEARSAAYAEDFNPNDQYYLKRTEFVSKTQLSVPMVPGLKFYVHYRDESRNGMYQARTLSKCSACHVVAKSRSINSYSRDIKIGTNIRLGKSNVDYSYTANEFKERDTAPLSYYLTNQHPENSSFVFTSRIGVGDNENLPFDVIPESKKGTHFLKAAIPLDDNKVFSAQYVSSKVENVNSNLEWKSNAFAGAFTARLGKKAFFNAILNYQKIDNDSVFVDINERVDIGGPYTGKIYADLFDFDSFDWTRYSSLSRTVINFKSSLRYKFSKKFKLRLGFDYEDIDREFYDVLNTKKSTFKVKFTLKPADKFKAVFDGKFSRITDPFANLNGGISEAVQLYATTSPLAPTAEQFYNWHLMRQGTMTAFPETVSELKGRVHWSPTSKFSLNANVLYKAEDNDNLVTTGASWNRELFQWGVDLWAMLSNKAYFSATYYDYSNVYSTMFAIAVLEGCGGAIIAGMPGTITDMMDLDNNNQTLLLSLNYMASKKLSMYLNFNYSNSASVIKELSLDESQVPYLPGKVGVTDLDFDNMGDTAAYSELDMKQMIAQLGANVMLSENWTLNGSIYYYLYDDIAEYLYTDTTGKSYSFYVGVTWKK